MNVRLHRRARNLPWSQFDNGPILRVRNGSDLQNPLAVVRSPANLRARNGNAWPRTVARTQYAQNMSRDWIAYLNHTAPGATQKALADAAGVDQSTVSRWKRGQGAPAPETAIHLARKIGAEPLGALVAAGHLTADEANAIVSHHEPAAITDAELLDILRDRLALARGRETNGATAATRRAGESPAPAELEALHTAIVGHFRHYAEQADEARKSKRYSDEWLARLRADFEAHVSAEVARFRGGASRKVG